MANQFYELFNLNKDQEQAHIIDTNIRAGVKVVGTNLWVLIFAILVASVGLNVNSTAVIIGAMLISPLMGPIVGIGYGTGINDFGLIKLAIRNLGIFTFISILSSTLYFTISPLNTATPELLARTSPNLWDVLIAFFGGAAGIIALTRKSISNVIPGVAIATALMPPLCTAGYGISQGNWEFFGGAFFLYCINSVFIAFATLVFVKVFKLPQHQNLDETTSKRTTLLIGMTVFLMIVPSAYLAYNFVQQNNFNNTADEVVASFSRDPNYIILGQEIDSLKREIIITVGGDNPPESLASLIESRLKSRGIEDTQVIVRTSGSGKIDMASLKSELQQDLYNNLQEQVNTLSQEKASLEKQVSNDLADKQDSRRLIKEIRAQYPKVYEISITKGETTHISQEKLIENVINSNTNQESVSAVDNPADSTVNQGNTKSNVNQTETLNKPDSQAKQKSSIKPIESETVRLILLKTEALEVADKARITDWLTARFNDKVVVEFMPVMNKTQSAQILQTP